MEGIKSAFERAWERASKLEVEEEKVKELQYQPEGAKIAALFLKEEKIDLLALLNNYEPDVRKYVQKGAEAVFLSNINLPFNERKHQENKRALEGLRLLKKDKSRFAQILGKIDSLFSIYERERQSLYEQLRAEFESTLRQALQQQGIEIKARIAVERQPEFQAKWREISAKFDSNYEERLKLLKSELEKLV